MRRAGSTSEAAKEEEVVMGTNQAYETVKIRYQSASRSRQQLHLHEQSTITGQEEPVYENN